MNEKKKEFKIGATQFILSCTGILTGILIIEKYTILGISMCLCGILGYSYKTKKERDLNKPNGDKE